MIKNLLAAAAASDRTFSIGAGDEIDYRGSSVQLGMEALEACDELDVTFYEHRLGKAYRCGAILYVRNMDDVNDLENICDAGGWANDWLDDNADY